MKKLSIEEKALRYDEAIKRGLDYIRHTPATEMVTRQDVFEAIFPEFKESEDRIRKNLIGYIKGISKNEVCEETKDSWIAWLEKQGKKDEEILVLKDQIESLHAAINATKNIHKIELEKLGFTTQSDDDKSEQKPADNTKPKFHEGDWVVQGRNILKIRYVGEEYYCYETVGGYVDDMLVSDIDSSYHLWNLYQDAKDGDILCTYECDEPKIVFIIKGTPKKHYALSYHCYYNIMYPHFGPDSEKGCLAPNDEDVKPATKDQRDTLFKAIVDAGYMWNSDSKQLLLCLKEEPNIEQKPSEWSEEDERLFQIVIDVLDRENHLGNISHTDLIACVRKLKSLIPQNKWKPSYEQMLAINAAVNVIGKDTLTGKLLIKLQEQLKKLVEK